MFSVQGNTIRMTGGDFGSPLGFRIGKYTCGAALLDSDRLRLSVSRLGQEYVSREWVLGGLGESGTFTLELTREESEQMAPGIYSWRICLIREEQVLVTLRDGCWVVGASAEPVGKEERQYG